MKRLLLPAFLFAALLSAPATSHAADGPKKPRTTKAQKKKLAAAPKPTSAANWGSTADDDALWATPAAAVPAVAATPVVAEPELNDDPAMHSSGVMIAPGMNTAPYRGVSTDYNGRPLSKPAKKAKDLAAAPAEMPEEAEDPMMRSSGVMIAPGMNTAPHRGVSTDYNGRPLKKKARTASTVAAQVAAEAPVATAEVPQW